MTRARDPRLLCACLAALLAAGRARAQDVRVNVYNLGGEGHLGIASFGQGFAVAWSTDEFCKSSAAARLFDLGGSFTTGDFQAQSCSGTMFYQAAAAFDGGPILIASQHGAANTNIYVQLFDTSGTPITTELTVPTADGPYEGPRAVADSAGHFVVAYTSIPFWSTNNVYARVVMPDGSMPSPDVVLPQAPPPSSPGFRLNGRIAAFAADDLVATWSDWPNGNDPTIWARRFDADLNPLTGDFQINQASLTGTGAVAGEVAAGTSRYVVAWHVGSTDIDVYAREFDRSGPLGNESRLNTYLWGPQGLPACAMDSLDRAVVLWISYGQDGSNYGIYGQRLDASGSPLGVEFLVNMTTQNGQGDPQIAMLPGGDFAVAFGSDTDQNQASDVLMRRFFFPVSLVLGVGPGPGSSYPATASTSRPDGGSGTSWNAYLSGAYGATVGAGNLEGAGIHDILTGPGPSAVFGPQVRAFRPDASAIAKVNFYAYGTLKYGVKEAGADVDGDPYSEILTTPGPGKVFGPHVRGFNYDNASLTAIQKISFFAYNTLRYGCNGSRGDVDGDSFDEILTAPGPGAVFGPQVRGFDYDNVSLTAIAKINFNAHPAPAPYGATVAASDIESDGLGSYGDGFDEIHSGRGPDPAQDADFRVFDYDGAAIAQKWAWSAFYPMKYGANVAGGDVDAGDTEEVVTAPGPDPANPARVRSWEWNPKLGVGKASLQYIGTDDFIAFQGPPQLYYGVNVAVGTFE